MLKDFGKSYVLNLHGSVRRSRKPPPGKSDENVFDIMQGVCITFFIKKNEKTEQASLFYQDLWGKREEKYEFLSKNIVPSTTWLTLKPKSPQFFFVPFYEKEEYEDFVPLKEIFIESSTGIKTHRDNFIVCPEKKILINRLEKFIQKNDVVSDEEIKEEFKLKETDSWKISKAREKLKKEGILTEKIKEYHYRPYDFRWTYHSSIVMNRARGELLENISKSNFTLVTTRQVTDPPFDHVFISNKLSDICLLSTKTKESAYFFPLKRIENGIEISNISEKLRNYIKKILKKDVEPEELFFYVYAILFSKKYRKQYDHSLLRDFPKIPITRKKDLFIQMVKLGKELADLHLLNTESLSITTEYPISGSNTVEKISYDEKQNRLYINEEQYFTNISPDIWQFKIGVYKVLDKWLNEKKNKTLLPSDIDIFQKIVNSAYDSNIFQKKIDELFSSIVDEIIEFNEFQNSNKINEF